jgi:hypothetical protein
MALGLTVRPHVRALVFVFMGDLVKDSVQEVS